MAVLLRLLSDRQHQWMSRRPTPLPAHLGEHFAFRAAREAGVSAGRLRGSDLITPFRGARMRSHDSRYDEPDSPATSSDASFHDVETRRLVDDIVRRAHAFAEVAVAGSFFCHVTAAVLWGLPVPLRLLREAALPGEKRTAGVAARRIDAGVLAPSRASRASGVHGRQLSPALTSIRTVSGLRVSSPASTWAMLADVLTVDELIALGDAAVYVPRRHGMQRGTDADALATPEQLTKAANGAYRRDTDKLIDALNQVRVGSASPAETRIRLACVRAGLPEPDLDVDVFASDGTAIGFTELAYLRYHLLIEYEGDHHRTDRRQWQRDVDKHAACFDAGYQVLRLTAMQAYPSVRPAVDRIRSALHRGGWRP